MLNSMSINPYYLTAEYLSEKNQSRKKIVFVVIENIFNPNACQFVRLINQYFNENIIIQYDIRFGKLEHIKKLHPDVVVFSRIVTTKLEEISTVIDYIKLNNMRMIYDVDDDLLNIPIDHPEFDFYNHYKNQIKYLIAKADIVTVSTPFLKHSLRQFNPNIRIYRNNRFLEPINLLRGDYASIMKLIYIASPSHERDLNLVLEPLKKLNDEGFQIQLCVVGLNFRPKHGEFINFLTVPAECNSYPVFMNWIKIFFNFDYGIAPLVNNQFNEAKSAIKYFDYIEMGVPTIASKIGEYPEFIVNKKNGFLVENNDWYGKLKNIYMNRCPTDRERFIQNAVTMNSEFMEKNDPIRILEKILEELF
jgi:glycosyltransferase involved in cell wall biosynthesis